MLFSFGINQVFFEDLYSTVNHGNVGNCPSLINSAEPTLHIITRHIAEPSMEPNIFATFYTVKPLLKTRIDIRGTCGRKLGAVQHISENV